MILRKVSRSVVSPTSALMRLSQTSSFSSGSDEEVLCTREGKKGLIVLNRPKQLNALNLNMVRKLNSTLQEWHHDRELIVIKGTGEKSFCAGGDVVNLARDRSGAMGQEFFRAEYTMNGRIASLKVPYVALLHGIVMGGGVGVSIHGKYRVATEKSLFAMPETLIGLFPDVGVSHFLSRMQHNMGMFLALTGYRLQGYDLCHTGIATHFCTLDNLPRLEDALLSSKTGPGAVDQILQDFHSISVQKLPNGQPPAFGLSPHLNTIETCFSARTVEDMTSQLQAKESTFTSEVLQMLRKVSPTSLKITAKQIRSAASLSVYDVLNMDYRLALRVLEGKEFQEGVRAQLIDKDKKPAWSPNQLQDISEETIQRFFEPLPSNMELGLPQTFSV